MINSGESFNTLKIPLITSRSNTKSKVTSTIKDFRLFIVSMPTLTFTSPKRWTITLRRIKAELLLVSFKTDWLYTPEQSLEIAKVAAGLGKPVNYVLVDSRKGHDGFLLETEAVSRILGAFLNKEVGDESASQ